MKDGLIKVAACTPEIKVADTAYNQKMIVSAIEEAAAQGAKIIVLPELCVTSYTAGDLFYQPALQNAAKDALIDIAKAVKNTDALIFIGLPLYAFGRLYNVAAAINKGNVLGFIPKTFLPNYNEFYEKRQFAGAEETNRTVLFNDKSVPFGTKLLFASDAIPGLFVGAEICEDLWAMSPPSVSHAGAGATVIVNLSASNELIGKAEYRRLLVCSQSARLLCGYIYANAGSGESTTDIVFAGHNLIAENGKMLNESKLFEHGVTVSEIDIFALMTERHKFANYRKESEGYTVIPFEIKKEETALTRLYPRYPFVPSDENELKERAELILNLQAHGLKKRLEHTKSKTAVIGVSGGLDSSLALIVAARTMKLLNRPVADVVGITMPCFGTTDRTYKNSCRLAEALGITFKKIDIGESVKRHLHDIGHDGKPDTAYENAQARERTQVLMDFANLSGGLVVGTGDLSELALGWSTYNGDHMSMYGVNASVPKTLVQYLIRYEALKTGGELQEVLFDILDTPISPELLPPDPDNGKIQQKTEDIIGPYALHDFFLYYSIRMAFSPSKVYRLARYSFQDVFTAAEIKKWQTVFIKRFFSQQFKRSCLPDGVKIGSVALSPRGDWRMPSDASPEVWLNDLQNG